MSKSSFLIYPTLSSEMPSCWAVDLAQIWWSSKISSSISSIISRVVNVLIRPGRVALQVEKSQFLNWATQVFEGGIQWCMLPWCLSEWREFPSAPCLVETVLNGTHVLMLKLRTSPDMLPVSLCNTKGLAILHLNRPFFPSPLVSILQHWEVGQAKDLPASQITKF